MRAALLSLLIATALSGGLAWAQSPAEPPGDAGRAVPAQQAGAYAPDDPRNPAPAPASAPSGFRLTVPICRRAESQNDPLAQTPECAAMLEQSRETTRRCAQAFADGDDKTAMSQACRQAAMTR